MTPLVARIDNIFYPGVERNWDDGLFRQRIMDRIRPASIVLDLGAGAGIVQQMNFRGMAARVCGVDLDPRVADNPMLDEGKVADGVSIPYDDGTFDVVFADNVLEHLSDPKLVFSEICRVLKPGGVFLFKTPNKWHYMPMVAKLTPLRFHQWVNRRRGRAEVDTFPTLYRANSGKAIRRLANSSGLEVAQLERIDGRPEYLRVNWLTYIVGVLYERIVSSTSFLSMFRVLLVGQLRKPA